MTPPPPTDAPDPSPLRGLAPSDADEAYPIRIARDGTWFYQGSPIGRMGLVRLFASVLSRDAAGDYWLITPAERGRITVDDAPFVAVELDAVGDGADARLRLRTNLDDWVEVGAEHPLRVAIDPVSGEPRPYVRVRPGLEARLNRPVFYELVERAVAAGGGAGGEDEGPPLGVWSGGCFFAIDGGDAGRGAS